jgi:hypothetical protein
VSSANTDFIGLKAVQLMVTEAATCFACHWLSVLTRSCLVLRINSEKFLDMKILNFIKASWLVFSEQVAELLNII